jgi:protoporphyrinogen oxidase
MYFVFFPGLGAATRMNQHKHEDWVLIEGAPEAGGLACTDITPEGFLFDMGGHVIFSHYDYFDELIDAAVGTGPENWSTHERVSYVWMKNRFVPYPFQNNICALPQEDQIECINGLIDAKVANELANAPPANFDEWIMRVMGKGIANTFMRPYNFKVWAIPTHLMQCTWLGERVATANVARVVENVIRNRIESSWGPNAVFRFPQEGGTGAIWKKVAGLLPQEKIQYNKTVSSFFYPSLPTLTLSPFIPSALILPSASLFLVRWCRWMLPTRRSTSLMAQLLDTTSC